MSSRPGTGCRAEAARSRFSPRVSRVPGPAISGYLVIIQPRLQNLIQLPRQRIVGLRRSPACPIAEAVGSPGRRDCDCFPVTLGHNAGAHSRLRSSRLRPAVAYCACAVCCACARSRLCRNYSAQPGPAKR